MCLPLDVSKAEASTATTERREKHVLFSLGKAVPRVISKARPSLIGGIMGILFVESLYMHKEKYP